MKIMFFGLGSIGRRHARLLQSDFPDFELFAARTTKKKGLDGVIDVRGDHWAAIEKIAPDVAFICNPTDKHIDTAQKCADLGMALFLEKPIDVTSGPKLTKLLQTVRENRLQTYVAYPLRHHPVLQQWKGKLIGGGRKAAIMHYTNIARWGKDYSRLASTGGGAILELSHEIDLAQWLFGKIVDISGTKSHSKDFEKFTTAETSAKITTTHADGMQVDIVLDIGSLKPMRHIFFKSSMKTIDADYECDDDVYLSQLQYFFDKLKKQSFMMNNLHEASELFYQIIDFRKEGRNGKAEKGYQ